MLGMMLGLGFLSLYSFYLKITHDPSGEDNQFEFFRKIKNAEWDTLIFFFGVILSVGGLGFIGYLSLISEFLYDGLGATIANVIVGILSAIVDNIPVMFAIITMRPEMSIDQWLLVTLTTGVGGSLLSIGSAAGVALMGQARGHYTFFGHLKWTPVIFIGYVASIYVHVLMTGLPW
jgi:Na+/H+ antiporter NhaD/arsenite permease-like protein